MADKIKKIDPVGGAIKNKRVVLIILDGWGLSPSWSGNAISLANPKNFNKYWREYPHAVLQAFKGVAESGNVGNSEIGHASIGSGRIIKQDLTEINEAIKNNYFSQNPVFDELCRHVIKFKSKLHIIGMLSDGGVHSHINHLFALMSMAKNKKINEVYLHLITDGIDAPDRSGVNFVNQLQNYIKNNNYGKIVTLIGRYYAMDKSGHTDRTEKAYLAQAKGKGEIFTDPIEALKSNYKKGIFDDMIPPIVIDNKNNISDYDGVIFFNFRADRARQLTLAYTDKNYFKSLFGRKHRMLKDIDFVSLTSYMLPQNTNVKVAFPSSIIQNTLSFILSRAGLAQIHIAESEKYAHVTYFFNGGKEERLIGEDRVIIPSPNVSSYEDTPAMSTDKIKNVIIKAIESKKYNFILANIANVDMVAHTGNIIATSNAIKITDKAIKEIVEANNNGITIITADHGNAEEIIAYKTSSNRETTHTANPVPFMIIDKNKSKNLVEEAFESTHVDMYDLLTSNYTLADIAPTILDLYGINKPNDMTGQSLLDKIGYK